MTLDLERASLEFAFVQDVLTHPFHATPILVYADWLMEQPDLPSQSRGEFLRLDCLFRHATNRAERQEIHWRKQTLWWLHVESWLGPLFEAVDHFHYESGRLRLEISERSFCRSILSDLTSCPAWNWVTDIVVRKGSLDLLLALGEIAPPPFLSRLDIGPRSLEGGELEYLITQGFWTGIPELSLRNNGVFSSDLGALAYWPGLLRVSHLDLNECVIRREGALSLQQSPFLDGLKELIVDPTSIDRDAYPLLQARFGDRLRLI